MIYKDIFGFEAGRIKQVNLLSIHNLVLVEGLEPDHDIGGVELGRPLLELLHMLEVEEELAPVSVLEYEEQLCIVLEGRMHFYDKRTLDLLLKDKIGVIYQNISFHFRPLYLFLAV